MKKTNNLRISIIFTLSTLFFFSITNFSFCEQNENIESLSQENISRPQFALRIIILGMSTHLWGFSQTRTHENKISNDGVVVYNPGGGFEFSYFPVRNGWYISYAFAAFNDCFNHAFVIPFTAGGGYNFEYKSLIFNVGLLLGFASIKQDSVTGSTSISNPENYPRKIFFIGLINFNIGFKISDDFAIQINNSLTWRIMFTGISFSIFIK